VAIPRLFSTVSLTREGTVMLDDAAASHAARVLRLRIGEAVTLFNGEGGETPATITHIDRRGVEVTLGAWRDESRESSLDAVLVQAMVSGDKLDTIIQKATELGVAAIHLIECERSVAKLTAEKEVRRLEHMRRVAIAACEQCGRNRPPAVLPPLPFAQWLGANATAKLLMLDPEADQALGKVMIERAPHVLIGPEGGFTANERRLALARGAAMVKVGPRVLRTETAGMAVLAVLQSRYGDWD
jgi:16S rRNA (uracil1498-N3)-methyltransferase